MNDPNQAIWEFIGIYAFFISAAIVAYHLIH
jgi:hypothetical protein